MCMNKTCHVVIIALILDEVVSGDTTYAWQLVLFQI